MDQVHQQLLAFCTQTRGINWRCSPLLSSSAEAVAGCGWTRCWKTTGAATHHRLRKEPGDGGAEAASCQRWVLVVRRPRSGGRGDKIKDSQFVKVQTEQICRTTGKL